MQENLETKEELPELIQITLTPLELVDLYNLYLLGFYCLQTNLGVPGSREGHKELLHGIIKVGPQSRNINGIAERLLKLGKHYIDIFEYKV